MNAFVWTAFYAVTGLAVLHQAADGKLLGPVCAKGGYCSCNTTKPKFTSDLDEASELKHVLEASAYKKEV